MTLQTKKTVKTKTKTRTEVKKQKTVTTSNLVNYKNSCQNGGTSNRIHPNRTQLNPNITFTDEQLDKRLLKIFENIYDTRNKYKLYKFYHLTTNNYLIEMSRMNRYFQSSYQNTLQQILNNMYRQVVQTSYMSTIDTSRTEQKRTNRSLTTNWNKLAQIFKNRDSEKHTRTNKSLTTNGNILTEIFKNRDDADLYHLYGILSLNEQFKTAFLIPALQSTLTSTLLLYIEMFEKSTIRFLRDHETHFYYVDTPNIFDDSMGAITNTNISIKNVIGRALYDYEYKKNDARLHEDIQESERMNILQRQNTLQNNMLYGLIRLDSAIMKEINLLEILKHFFQKLFVKSFDKIVYLATNTRKEFFDTYVIPIKSKHEVLWFIKKFCIRYKNMIGEIVSYIFSYDETYNNYQDMTFSELFLVNSSPRQSVKRVSNDKKNEKIFKEMLGFVPLDKILFYILKYCRISSLTTNHLLNDEVVDSIPVRSDFFTYVLKLRKAAFYPDLDQLYIQLIEEEINLNNITRIPEVLPRSYSARIYITYDQNHVDRFRKFASKIQENRVDLTKYFHRYEFVYNHLNDDQKLVVNHYQKYLQDILPKLSSYSEYINHKRILLTCHTVLTFMDLRVFIDNYKISTFNTSSDRQNMYNVLYTHYRHCNPLVIQELIATYVCYKQPQHVLTDIFNIPRESDFITPLDDATFTELSIHYNLKPIDIETTKVKVRDSINAFLRLRLNFYDKYEKMLEKEECACIWIAKCILIEFIKRNPFIVDHPPNRSRYRFTNKNQPDATNATSFFMKIMLNEMLEIRTS
jgi:hypothetical protein